MDVWILCYEFIFYVICFIIFIQADNQSTSKDKIANAPTSDKKVSDFIHDNQPLVDIYVSRLEVKSHAEYYLFCV